MTQHGGFVFAVLDWTIGNLIAWQNSLAKVKYNRQSYVIRVLKKYSMKLAYFKLC